MIHFFYSDKISVILPAEYYNNQTIMINSILLFALGTGEIILIALVVLLIFGGKKIPELMRGLGKGVSQFKKGIKDIDDELNDGLDGTKLK
jgi:sec-independent protein translocase protein TatA